MFCPNCDAYIYLGKALSACDCGEPDMEAGTRCPECDNCIPDADWLREEEES